MKKIEEILKKNFVRLKKEKINDKTDLIKSALIDSLELLKLLTILEKKYNFNLKSYQKKYKNFIVKNLDNFIK
jgi:acyl carrier protein